MAKRIKRFTNYDRHFPRDNNIHFIIRLLKFLKDNITLVKNFQLHFATNLKKWKYYILHNR